MHSEAGFTCVSSNGGSSDFGEVFIARAPFTLAAADESDGGCNTVPWHCSLPGYNLTPYFERNDPFFLPRVVTLVAIRQQQTHVPPFFLKEACSLGTGRDSAAVPLAIFTWSFVMHAWSIYSLCLHWCPGNVTYRSKLSLCVFADTLR